MEYSSVPNTFRPVKDTILEIYVFLNLRVKNKRQTLGAFKILKMFSFKIKVKNIYKTMEYSSVHNIFHPVKE